MLSKRNFGMMMTIILVILILFLSSAVLREYFNDYNGKKKQKRIRIVRMTGISFMWANRIPDIMKESRNGARIEKQNLKKLLK